MPLAGTPGALAAEGVKPFARQVGLCQLHGAEPGKSWVARTGAGDMGNFRREVLET